ncbi:hypothetical protein Y032_0720g1816 [Ancylostoma ceylanicum]|uniref:F-box domain-containing protein n=1 Tax=Ancylostoma ceylanicum TaxID=53326 RepID=A0A016WEX8_9BILA|nr:hypothetical protein Y032_0720g1816 [Ancylostoma ceylanicum]
MSSASVANAQQLNPGGSRVVRYAASPDLEDSDGQCLADLAFVEGKKVKWALKMDEEDNEFYLYLKDVDAFRAPLHDFLRDLFTNTAQQPTETFAFLDLPPEVQIQILKKVSLRDLSSCRLTCHLLNQIIVRNWNSLSPRKIGCVDFIPGCNEVWGLYFDYTRKLVTFTNAVISRLVLYYGVISSPLLLSLAQELSQARITVKAMIIHNCRCCCEAEELIAFVKSAHVEVLAIDVFEMRDFGKSLLMNDVIQKLKCVFIFSNGDDVMSGIVVDPFYYDHPIEVHGLRRLLAVLFAFVYVVCIC